MKRGIEERVVVGVKEGGEYIQNWDLELLQVNNELGWLAGFTNMELSKG